MKSRLSRILSILLAAVIAVAAYAVLRPLPPAQAKPVGLNLVPPAAVNLPWPASGQAAFGTLNDGELASNGSEDPVPIASVAKIITALCVLKQKPVQAGSEGPTITLGPADVAVYDQYVAEGGSVVAITNGEQITESKAIEAMLLPSANNMAYSLAVWAFGSIDNYTSFANSYVKALGMKNTTVTDPSGFDPKTVSTASDLIKLGQTTLSNPVLTAIVDTGSVNVPVAGNIQNTNWLLGNDGVIGIKTGNTDQAGGCYLFAAELTIAQEQVTVIGAILGDSSVNQAIRDGDNVILAANHNFRIVFVGPGQTVATYKTAWGATVSAVTKNNIHVVSWIDRPVKSEPILETLSGSQNAGTKIGNLQLSAGSAVSSGPVVLKSAIKKPPISWRLTHIF